MRGTFLNTEKPKARTKRPDECPVCEGKGYTAETSAEWEIKNGQYKTRALGSGCPKCHGIGVIA